MTELTVDKEPIPYDERNITINGFVISHNGTTIESEGIQRQKFAEDDQGRYWDVEVLPDGSGVIVSVEVNTDQVLKWESVEYENNRFDGPSEFCRWLESGSFELVTDS